MVGIKFIDINTPLFEALKVNNVSTLVGVQLTGFNIKSSSIIHNLSYHERCYMYYLQAYEVFVTMSRVRANPTMSEHQ